MTKPEPEMGASNMEAADPHLADDEEFAFDWTRAKAMMVVLKDYYRLFWAVFGFGVLCMVICYVLYPPKYTAVAVVGPAEPSPTDSMIATMGVNAGMAGLASKVLGGSSGGETNDPYQEYLQLLPSTRLSQVLIKKDHILPVIFHKYWDPDAKAWYPSNPFVVALNFMNGMLQRADNPVPGLDDLENYLEKEVDVGPSDAGPSTGAASLLTSSNYMEVSFEFDDPRQAERVLNTMLWEADQIVRNETKEDIRARVAFVTGELKNPNLTSDERDVLISNLASQEQILSMVLADKRFASTLVVPAIAPDEPTFPPNPLIMLAATLLLAVMSWAALVFWGPRVRWIARIVKWFERKKPAKGTGATTEVAHA